MACEARFSHFLRSLIFVITMELTTGEDLTFSQMWTTNTTKIQMQELRRDCANSSLSSVTVVDGLSIQNTNQCNRSFADLYMNHIAHMVQRCYEKNTCKYVTLDKTRGFLYSNCTACTASGKCYTRLSDIQALIQVKVTVGCTARDDGQRHMITQTPLTTNLIKVIPQACEGGKMPKILHMFGLNQCSKSLDLTAEQYEYTQSSIRKVERCRAQCDGVPKRYLVNVGTGQGHCKQQLKKHSTLVIYWSCSLLPASPDTIETITPGTDNKAESGKVDGQSGSNEINIKQPDSNSQDYLLPFVIVTILLVIVTLVLAALSVLFIKKRRQAKLLVNKRDSKPPPSRGSLYAAPHQAIKNCDQPYDLEEQRYEVPRTGTLNNYQNSQIVNKVEDNKQNQVDENAYEVMGTPADEHKPLPGSDIYEDGYLVPNTARKQQA